MSSSDDIANLFKQFGGKPGQYQEIGRDRLAQESRERWPLLAAVDPGEAPPIPAVPATGTADAMPREAERRPAARPLFLQEDRWASAPPPPVVALSPSVPPVQPPAPTAAPAVRPFAQNSAPAPAPAPAPAATPLQETFARLARPAAVPSPAPADAVMSLLRRLLRS